MKLHRSAEADDECAVLLQVLDDLAVGVAIVAADLHVVESNAAARAICAQRDGLELDQGRLRATIEASEIELHGAFRQVTAKGGSAYALARRRADAPIQLCIRALRPSRSAVAVVYAVDPAAQLLTAEDLLRRTYRFSPAECRVATLLVQGQTCEAIAEVLSLSRHTVRTHLKNIFAKTGTARQAELVRLLAMTSFVLRIRSEESLIWGMRSTDPRA